MRRLRPWLLAAVALVALALGGLLAARHAVLHAARGRLHDEKSAPPRPVAIVFGAAVGSQVLRDRVATGAALYHAHKVRHLLLSGDNRRRSYDEPRAMRKLALDLGVPGDAIVLDYAGRRTYDSCARARQIFGVGGAILVTQGFHLARAIYLCQHLGLGDVVGVAADRQAYPAGPWFEARELGASLRAWLDVNLWKPRVVGGPAEPILDGDGGDGAAGEDDRQ